MKGLSVFIRASKNRYLCMICRCLDIQLLQNMFVDLCISSWDIYLESCSDMYSDINADKIAGVFCYVV